jgi:mannose-6-phosphate isomerase-like protein (cupin superfamily)
MSGGQTVPETKLEHTEAGLVPAGEGWFVVNAREARWIERPGRGYSVPLTGWTEEEAETYFRQLGINLVVLGPGEPIGMYHWEADQEGFLVLSGDALLIVEGEERRLGPWDFVHCPPETKHVFVGAGEAGCVLIAAGSREHIGEHCNGGAYVVDETALRHGAAITEETDAPYAHLPEPRPTRYREGWLPFGA